MGHEHITIIPTQEFEEMYNNNPDNIGEDVSLFYKKLAQEDDVMEALAKIRLSFRNAFDYDKLEDQILLKHAFALLARDGPKAEPLITIKNLEELALQNEQQKTKEKYSYKQLETIYQELEKILESKDSVSREEFEAIKKKI